MIKVSSTIHNNCFRRKTWNNIYFRCIKIKQTIPHHNLIVIGERFTVNLRMKNVLKDHEAGIERENRFTHDQHNRENGQDSPGNSGFQVCASDLSGKHFSGARRRCIRLWGFLIIRINLGLSYLGPLCDKSGQRAEWK